jgi:hypothetical protein
MAANRLSSGVGVMVLYIFSGSGARVAVFSRLSPLSNGISSAR